jgi:bifunctional DNA primase/polymerase-like protein
MVEARAQGQPGNRLWELSSNLIVLEVDPAKGGLEALAHLIEEYGAPPETYTVRSGGGGTHYYFTTPEPFNYNDLNDSLSVRGGGESVVAPPRATSRGRRMRCCAMRRSHYCRNHGRRYGNGAPQADAPGRPLDTRRPVHGSALQDVAGESQARQLYSWGRGLLKQIKDPALWEFVVLPSMREVALHFEPHDKGRGPWEDRDVDRVYRVVTKSEAAARTQPDGAGPAAPPEDGNDNAAQREIGRPRGSLGKRRAAGRSHYGPPRATFAQGAFYGPGAIIFFLRIISRRPLGGSSGGGPPPRPGGERCGRTSLSPSRPTRTRSRRCPDTLPR